MIYSTINLIHFWYFRVVIHSFDTKNTQNGVNKTDRIMHSQGGKGIFSQFKKYLQEFTEENQKRCSLVHTIVDYIKYK